LYAAILSPKGKILHDLIVYRSEALEAEEATGKEQGVLIEVDARGKKGLLDLLTRWGACHPTLVHICIPCNHADVPSTNSYPMLCRCLVRL